MHFLKVLKTLEKCIFCIDTIEHCNDRFYSLKNATPSKEGVAKTFMSTFSTQIDNAKKIQPISEFAIHYYPMNSNRID
jgi:hypothetical protein